MAKGQKRPERVIPLETRLYAYTQKVGPMNKKQSYVIIPSNVLTSYNNILTLQKFSQNQQILL